MLHRMLPPVASAEAHPSGAAGCSAFMELVESLSTANRRGIGKMRYSNVKNDCPSGGLQWSAWHLDEDESTDVEG
jgi:hypothetical protein